MVSFVMELDPLTFEEAMKSNDSAFWTEAVNDDGFYYGKQNMEAC